jgi:hypothetical protein
MKHTNIRKGNWVRVIQKDGTEALGKVHAAYLTGDQLFSVVVDGVFKNYRGHEVISKAQKPV